MTCCSAPNCKNRTEQGFRMFRFPSLKDKRYKTWLHNMRRGGSWKPSANSRLCEVHFDPSQFEAQRKDGLRKLKPNATPTLFNVPNPPPKIDPHPGRSIFKEVTTSAYSNLVEENEKLQGDVTVAENPAILELQQEKTVAENAAIAELQQENDKLCAELGALLNAMKGDEEKNSVITTRLTRSSRSGDRSLAITSDTPNLGLYGDFATSPVLPNDVPVHKKNVPENSSVAQPELVVLLNNNYGFPSGDKSPAEKSEVSVAKFNTSMNVTSNAKNAAVNGANLNHHIHFKQEENRNTGSTALELNNTIDENIPPNSDSYLVQNCTSDEKRCRSCLKKHPTADCKKITDICYLDKTIEEAISRLIPEINFPLQDTDIVCDACFRILKGSLEFISLFVRADKILKSEFDDKQKDPLHHSTFKISPKYAPLKDNFTLGMADKILSLSKIDNHNLIKFIETLQLNQVTIFQHETNPFARKRVLLLGNPKLRRCYVCYAEFLSESQLLDHLNSEHQITKEYLVKPIRHVTSSEEEPLTCPACGKTFLSEFNLKSHLKWCISFSCPHCTDHKTFACDKLLEHTREAHGDKFPFKCCKCKKEFDEYRMYVKHNCTTHACNSCGKIFPSTAALNYHTDKHKVVPCNVAFGNCNICKEIVRSEEYGSHMSAHKKLVCSKCGMRFYQSETLTEHEKTHATGMKMHKCKICPKVFLKEKSLQKHEESHNLPEGDEEICEICNEKFSSIKSLRQHITNSHGDPSVKCELCGKQCRPQRLKQHIEMKHTRKSKNQCPLCSKTFVQFIHYKRHMDVHTYGKVRSKIQKSELKHFNTEQDLLPINQEQELLESNLNEEVVEDPENQQLVEVGIDSNITEAVDDKEEYINEMVGHKEDVNTEKNNIMKRRFKQRKNTKGMNHSKRRKVYNFAVNGPNGPLICKYCLKSFSNLPSLTVHVQTHFQLQKNEKCSHCDLTFLSKATRIRHERTHTAPAYNFRCNVCWRIMQNQEELDIHMKSHINILACEQCDEKFSHQWQLDGHHSSHHAKDDLP